MLVGSTVMLLLFPKERLPAWPLRFALRRVLRLLPGLVACSPKRTRAASRLNDRSEVSEDASECFASSLPFRRMTAFRSAHFPVFPKKHLVVWSPLLIAHPKVCALLRPTLFGTEVPYSHCPERPCLLCPRKDAAQLVPSISPRGARFDLVARRSRKNDGFPIQQVVPEGSSCRPPVRYPRKGFVLPGRILSSEEDCRFVFVRFPEGSLLPTLLVTLPESPKTFGSGPKTTVYRVHATGQRL